MNSDVQITGWNKVNGESELANVIGTIGPVTAYIYAGTDDFRFYEGGIYNDSACGSLDINHAVNLVGYASDYYILRNSWGTNWGKYASKFNQNQIFIKLKLIN
jgi:C1A family cysteine protease